MKNTWKKILLIMLTSTLVFGCKNTKTLPKGTELELCNGLSSSIKLPKLNWFEDGFIELQHSGDTLNIIASYIHVFSSDMELDVDGTNYSNSVMVEPNDCMKSEVNVDYEIVEKYLIISFENKLYRFEKEELGKYILTEMPSVIAGMGKHENE